MDQYVWLIPTLPLLAASLSGIGLITFQDATLSLRRVHAYLALSCMALAFVIASLTLFNHLHDEPSTRWVFEWIFTETFRLEVGYWVDPLTSVMLVLVTSVAFLVMLYSDSYMEYDEGYVRFFCYLSLFTTSMLGLVLSPNLIQVYAFWELVGMCSYLLIGFWFTRPAAAHACQKAFVTNRVGDFGLLLGILGLFWLTGSFEFSTMADRFSDLNGSYEWVGLISCFLVFLGPVAKSAQFPLHVWLPDAMEGPTPISALIHAATMVAAGIFLVARMFPIFDQLPAMMDIIAWTGTITAFLGATIALSQTDLKKGLAYSTMSQLGYMMMALGVGAYSAGLFHLLTHAYSKALLFLGSGSVIHGMEGPVGFNPKFNQNMYLMGGLRKFMPITGTTFLIGTCSIAGFPPLACFWSKDAILSETFATHPLCWFIAWLTAGMTSFYMFRIYFLTFEGEFRGKQVLEALEISPASSVPDPHESGRGLWLPLVILTVPTVLIGLLGVPWNDSFATLVHPPGLEESLVEFEWEEFAAMAGSSVGIGLIGLTISSKLYRSENPVRFDRTKSWLPLDRLSSQKWYIDELYQNVFVDGTRQLANLCLKMDQFIIDATVNQTATATIASGQTLKATQSGFTQFYLTAIIFLAFLFLGIFTFGS
jgi:NAD(P)H-quinone oxidoreductase subunit 5